MESNRLLLKKSLSLLKFQSNLSILQTKEMFFLLKESTQYKDNLKQEKKCVLAVAKMNMKDFTQTLTALIGHI